MPAFHTIYFKHGNDLYTVLGMANMMNVHIAIKYISIEQFQNDINYLYYALKQALKSRGSDLVVTAEDTCDGIIVYHNLIQKYKYGGDRETYKSKLVILIHTQYYDGFPGGGIAYLDRW